MKTKLTITAIMLAVIALGIYLTWDAYNANVADTDAPAGAPAPKIVADVIEHNRISYLFGNRSNVSICNVINKATDSWDLYRMRNNLLDAYEDADLNEVEQATYDFVYECLTNQLEVVIAEQKANQKKTAQQNLIRKFNEWK